MTSSNTSSSVPLFGGSANNATTSAGSNLFGQQSSSEAPNVFSFGSNTNTGQSNAPKPFTFGSNTGSNIFGSNTNTNTGSNSFGFGSNSNTLGSTSTQSTSLFGTAQNANQSKPLSFGFGSNANSNVTSNATTNATSSNLSGFSLGAPTTQNKPLFGSAASSQSSLFGGSSANQPSSNPPSSSNLFGSTTSNAASNAVNTGASLFGNTLGTSGTNSLLGGQPKLFGNAGQSSTKSLNQSSNTQSSGLFGAQQQSSGLFGPQQQQSSALFGAQQQSTSLFGPQQQPSGLSGQPSFSSSTNSIFGSSFNPSNSLIASLDQGSYSLGTGFTPNRSLGPLTHPNSNGSTPSGRTGRSSPYKAPPVPRLILSHSRNAPYSSSRRENDLRRSNSSYSIRASEKLFDDLTTPLETAKKNEFKKLVIQRTPHSLEEITGRPSLANSLPLPDSNRNDNNSSNGSLLLISHRPAPSKPLNYVESRPSSLLVSPFAPTPAKKPRSLLSKVVQINQTAIDEGYWISPSFEALYQMTPTELSNLSNLMIGRKGYGQITYNEPVDMTAIDDYSNILGNLVCILRGKVIVYPDSSTKHAQGTGLNHPATITLENMFRIDKKTNRPITDPSDPRFVKYVSKLRHSVESRGGEFVTFDASHGSWTFRVPHFSVWGLIDDDEDDDIEEINGFTEANSLQPMADLAKVNGFDHEQKAQSDNFIHQNVFPQRRPVENHDMDMDFDGPSGDFNEVHNYVVPPQQEQHYQDQEVGTLIDFDTVEDHKMDISPTEVDEHDEKLDIRRDDMHPHIKTKQAPRYSDMFLDRSVIDVEDVLKPKVAASWTEQLKLAQSVDSTLAVDMTQPASKRNIPLLSGSVNVASLDEMLFGGTKALDDTITETYNKAAKSLRLPDISVSLPLGKFTSSPGKLIIKDPFGSNSGIHIQKEGFQVLPSLEIRAPFKHLLEQSVIENRENGAPLCFSVSNLSFSDIGKDLAEQASQDEKRIWELCAVLFDRVNLNFPDGFDHYLRDKLIEQHRREKLSKWLENYVEPIVDKEVSSLKDGLESVFVLLTGNRIEEACDVAVKSRNLHLATLLPLLGADDESIRKDAKDQLDNWVSNKSLHLIPAPTRKIYELLAGNALTSVGVRGVGSESVEPVDLCQGLDWKRAFGMSLWYGTTKSDEISDAVQKYTTAFQNHQAVSRPLKEGSSDFDLLYRLLRLYRNPNPQLSSILTLHEGSYRVAWLLYQVLVRSSGIFRDEEARLGNALAVSYGYELAARGQWLEAIYVLSGLTRDEEALRHVQRVLTDNCKNFSADVAVRGRLKFALGIREDLLFEVEALQARYEEDYLIEANKLLSAKLWDEAHKRVIRRVAPLAVIENKIDLLIEVLSRFEHTDAIFTWDIGGKVYLEYAKLVKAVQPSMQPVDRSYIEERVSKLVGPLGRMKTGSFEVRVAVSIMSSFVSKYATEEYMKMDSNDHLQQTLDLSVNYFKNRLRAC